MHRYVPVLVFFKYNHERPVEAKVIEEKFVRFGQIMNLHIAGQVIRTTPVAFMLRGASVLYEKGRLDPSR